MHGNYIRDESGATAIEYVLIAALVAIACSVTLGEVGVSLNEIFSTISSTLAPPSDAPTKPPVALRPQ